MKQTQSQPRMARWEGYLLIPHELLHLVGFWLVGKRCRYRWADPFVTPIEPMSRRKRLVGVLFPFTIFSLLTILGAVLATIALGYGSLFWFLLWSGLSLIAGIYAGTAVTDLRRAYLLIFDKPWYSWTPFDIFFWPMVDWSDVRESMISEKDNEQQD